MASLGLATLSPRRTDRLIIAYGKGRSTPWGGGLRRGGKMGLRSFAVWLRASETFRVAGAIVCFAVEWRHSPEPCASAGSATSIRPGRPSLRSGPPQPGWPSPRPRSPGPQLPLAALSSQTSLSSISTFAARAPNRPIPLALRSPEITLLATHPCRFLAVLLLSPFPPHDSLQPPSTTLFAADASRQHVARDASMHHRHTSAAAADASRAPPASRADLLARLSLSGPPSSLRLARS